MIELRTLGTLALRAAGGEDLHSVLAQPKRVALLAYLALARPHGFHRRDTLLALLWPEQDERHARWALNQALRHLRSALGKQGLPSRGDGEVGIEPGTLWCDAAEFEDAIERDDLPRALELYRGDLLEGFHVSDCGEFERWLGEERVWLRRRAGRAAATLALREEARSEPVAAGHWARRALVLAPDDEGEVRGLIQLLGRVGDRAGAVRAYEEFARRLHDEYEVEPAPETAAAIAAVRRRQRTPPADFPAVSDHPPSGQGEAAPEPLSLSLPSSVTGLRRQAILLALGLVVLLALGGTILTLHRPAELSGAPAASPTTIAVLPFAYHGSPEFAYLGDGMVDLLSADLDGAGEIRTVDPYAVLALTREADRKPPDPEEARTLAARLGAGAHVQGNVVETGGRLRISARLYPGGSEEGRGEVLVSGPPTRLFALVDGLTEQLIAQQSGGPTGSLSRLAALTTDSLAALKAYLEGERYFRAGQGDSSLGAFERAVRIDSSFALAHYRLAMAVWKFVDWGSPLAKEALDRALRHSHRLSDSDRRLFRALAALLHGRFAEAERSYRDIVSWQPDNVEATYILAELILHRERDRELRYSWLDAREWFQRVLAIDPSHRHALTHLSHIAARERRLGELDSLTERVHNLGRRPGRGSVASGSPDWLLDGQRAIVFGDTAAIDRFLTRLRDGGDEVQPPAGFLVFTTGDLEVGRRIWRVFTEPPRSQGLRVLAHLTLAKMEVMTGRWSAAKAELAAAAALDPATALEHRALLSLWPLMRVPRSELLALRDTLLRWKAVAGPSNQTSVSGDHAPAHPYLRLCLLGLFHVRLGDHAAALAGAAELERRAERSFAPAFVRDLGRALRAEIARARGSAAEALMILDSLEYWTDAPLDATGDSPFFVHEREGFARAELLGALGREHEALRAFRTIADYLFHSGAPAHFHLAEIYQGRGERQKAAEHYARFAELWKDCDPELRPLVREARSRAAQLAGSASGYPDSE